MIHTLIVHGAWGVARVVHLSLGHPSGVVRAVVHRIPVRHIVAVGRCFRRAR